MSFQISQLSFTQRKQNELLFQSQFLSGKTGVLSNTTIFSNDNKKCNLRIKYYIIYLRIMSHEEWLQKIELSDILQYIKIN